MRISKKRKEANAKVDTKKLYSLEEASKLIKSLCTAKFDASVDLHIRLGVDPTKADQLVRGAITLPHGTGKTKRILVLCPADKEAEAKEAGADFFGMEEYIQKIEGGWTDVDVIVATPAVMPKIGKLGKILGSRNLMPNPRTGTVTNDVKTAVNEIKKGKISFRVDKAGIIHCSIGRVSFDATKIQENAKELIQNIVKMKPATAKGVYLKSIALATSMGPAVRIEPNIAI